MTKYLTKSNLERKALFGLMVWANRVHDSEEGMSEFIPADQEAEKGERQHVFGSLLFSFWFSLSNRSKDGFTHIQGGPPLYSFSLLWSLKDTLRDVSHRWFQTQSNWEWRMADRVLFSEVWADSTWPTSVTYHFAKTVCCAFSWLCSNLFSNEAPTTLAGIEIKRLWYDGT